MNPKVSILIPCYNVEKYIRQCLDSVVNQTLKDIEIICINDGSTDCTLDILREYEQNDNRIKVISKHNSGYGASMNIGLETAKSEYIGIVESDDFVELNMFEKLYCTAKDNDLDLVRCQYYLYKSSNNSNELFDNTWVPMNKVYCPLDDNTPFMQAPAIWCNLFKKDMINDNNIRFMETPGASYQDTSFAFKLYASAKRFMLIEDAFMHYRIDNENSSVNSSTKANYVLIEYAEIKRFAKEHGIYKKLKYLIPKIRYACYRWNHGRLVKRLKFPFLLKMSKEYFVDFIQGNIKRSLFSKKEFKRIFIISFFPFLYMFRREL